MYLEFLHRLRERSLNCRDNFEDSESIALVGSMTLSASRIDYDNMSTMTQLLRGIIGFTFFCYFFIYIYKNVSRLLDR